MMLRIMRTKAIAVLLALFLSKTTVDALSTASPAVSNNNNNNKPDNVNAIDNDDNSKLIQVERAMIEFHVAEIANGNARGGEEEKKERPRLCTLLQHQTCTNLALRNVFTYKQQRKNTKR